VPTDTTVLKIATTESGLGPSDHASFYLRDIPVLHFFTGQHEDYHKPSDDADKINYEGLYEANSYIYRLLQVSGKGDKPAFTKTKDVSPGRSPFRVTLGVMPDYAFPGPGLRLDGVSEGKPAAAAGLQRGDIILQLSDMPILNVNDYMAALQKLNKGQTVTLLYKRQ
jgi:S1-C subfamily serine protease